MADPISDLLNRGTVDVIVREDLEKKLKARKPLRIKLGIDPTGSVLHLGHGVVLRKMREFQELGHQVIFLIGDFTARIGDPTGRSIERKPMTDEEIEANMKNYIQQASLILDIDRVEIRYNSEWLGKLNFKEIITLAAKVTFAQIAQRSDFKHRIENDIDLSLQEFMYPIMQGYDSVALKADVELGGTDQKFNLLMGRQIQERYGQTPQNILTCAILEGLDGVEKMSKSLNNYIALTETPFEIYGKIMSIQDQLMMRYFELATTLSLEEIESLKASLEGGTNPRDIKMRLAREVVALYHTKTAAQNAEEQFVQIFSKKQIPDDVPEKILPAGKEISLLDLIVESDFAPSKSEARRLMEGGGVQVNSQKISDKEYVIKPAQENLLLQVGKRKFLNIKWQEK